MFEESIFLMAMPRSGSSWVGQIFDSCPAVRYRYQPLFAYQFRGRDLSSELFEEIYLSEDEFISQRSYAEFRGTKQYPEFQKVNSPRFMVIKMIRFHHLVSRILEYGKIVYLVRHPCGHINSWLQSPELPADADSNEWRTGEKKKKHGFSEYCGLGDWKSVTLAYLSLAAELPSRCRIQRYERMVEDTIAQTKELFEWCGIPVTKQTEAFIHLSKGRHSNHPYAVLKNSSYVKDRWRSELASHIQEEIIREVTGTPLEVFL